LQDILFSKPDWFEIVVTAHESLADRAFDSELLECQKCNQAYEVKYEPDGRLRLVAV
jgi:hypothetical protein